MFNIKKQINLLYITSILSNLSITGAWVAILAARGFSLVQIGFAETIFHITSLIFEIPSGILADVYGRKNMLLVSQIMALVGNIIMALSGGIEMVCLSMIFVALSFNFASGSGDALAYDSLKSEKQEAKYLWYWVEFCLPWQMMHFRYEPMQNYRRCFLRRTELLCFPCPPLHFL